MSSFERKLSARRSVSQTLYGYLALARISNSPTVVSNVLAGAALAGATAINHTSGVLALALVLFYTAGMYLNDLCDYAIDCRQRPERPLPAGSVSRTEATAIVLALFGSGSALLWSVSLAAFLAGLLLTALIVAYDLWHKSNPLSPVLMASTRMMVYVSAFVSFSTQVAAALVLWSALLGLYIVALTYIAKTEARPPVTQYWPAGALMLPALVFLVQVATLPGLLVLVPFVGWVAYSLSFVYRRRQRSIGGAIARLIAGISLLDSLVLALAGAWAGVLLAWLAFGVTLFFQRYIKGT